MYKTPTDASDSQINSLFEIAQQITQEHAERLKADPDLAARLDAGGMDAIKTYAETLGPLARSTPVIDLQRRYKIDVEPCHGGGYQAIDLNSYDGAPDSSLRARTIGYGTTPQAAILDLLDQLAEYDNPEPPTERAAMLERAERQAVADARMIQAANDLQALRDAIEAWDPDWREHYGTFASAEANYHRAMERRP